MGGATESRPMQDTSRHGPLRSGDTLNKSKYIIRDLLGKGGTGWVYRGEEPRLGREVVIKIIDPDLLDDEVTKGSLIYEARAAVQLDHPNVIKVYTMDEEELDGDEYLYLVIEFATMGDLRAAFPKIIKTDLDRYRVMIEVLRGLNYVHKKGLIHRDLKPDNLFVKDHVVKIGDLGTAKSVGEKTRENTVQGIMTPVYSSPEQLNFEELDARSDIYTCGIIFFEIMTGKRPYKHLDEHLSKSPPPMITDLVEDLDEQIADVIATMMAKPKEHRYQNIDDILKDLVQVKEIQDAGFLEDIAPAAKSQPTKPVTIEEPLESEATEKLSETPSATPANSGDGGLEKRVYILVGLLLVAVVALLAYVALTGSL